MPALEKKRRLANHWLIPALGVCLLVGWLPRLPAICQPMQTTFTDVTAEAGLADNGNVEGAAWGDFDHDGDLDLFTCHHLTVPPAGDSVLYQNNGNGRLNLLFRMQSLMGRAAQRNNSTGKNDDHSPAWGDFDNDGDLDLYISRGNGQPDSLLRNDGPRGFIDVAETAGVADPGGRGRTATWVDVDNDGFLDLFITNHATSNRLYRNRGDGTFVDMTAHAGLSGSRSDRKATVWADYNQDGWMDVFITETRDPRDRNFDPPLNRLYRNEGGFTFTDVTAAVKLPLTGYSQGAAWGDYDNDGDLDLFVVNEQSPHSLYENNGDGTFTDVALRAGVAEQRAARAALWGDHDNDGDLDLYLSLSSRAPRLYRNNGDGTFTDVAALAGLSMENSSMQWGAAWGDYNNDGFLDLFLTDQRISGGRYSHLLYRNNGNQNHWLTLKLVGTRSNRDGVGATVTLMAGGLTQFREQNGGSHLLSQNSSIIHFGLGSTRTVDWLIIRWPSGLRQHLRTVAADQILTITEPAN